MLGTDMGQDFDATVDATSGLARSQWVSWRQKAERTDNLRPNSVSQNHRKGGERLQLPFLGL